MTAVIAKLKEQLTAKGQELITFKQKHSIKIAGEGDSEPKSGNSDSSSKTPAAGSQGVLVSQ